MSCKYAFTFTLVLNANNSKNHLLLPLILVVCFFSLNLFKWHCGFTNKMAEKGKFNGSINLVMMKGVDFSMKHRKSMNRFDSIKLEIALNSLFLRCTIYVNIKFLNPFTIPLMHIVCFHFNSFTFDESASFFSKFRSKKTNIFSTFMQSMNV